MRLLEVKNVSNDLLIKKYLVKLNDTKDLQKKKKQ